MLMFVTTRILHFLHFQEIHGFLVFLTVLHNVFLIVQRDYTCNRLISLKSKYFNVKDYLLLKNKRTSEYTSLL